jgi:hemoglobin
MTPARQAGIADRQDIADILVAFYSRLFADDMLGPGLVDVAHMDPAGHLPAMCDFWDTVLHRRGRYRRNPFQVCASLHDKAPLTAAHLSRWVALWTATCDGRHVGAKADLAKLAKLAKLGNQNRVVVQPPSTAAAPTSSTA